MGGTSKSTQTQTSQTSPYAGAAPALTGILDGINSLLPGAAVTGYLTVPGKPKSGVLVPSSALVRFEVKLWLWPNE